MAIGHNALHKSDIGNYWKYAMDLNVESSANWRVFHDLSHHHYPNTELDMEAYASEPFMFYFSNKPSNSMFISIIWPILICIY